MAAMGTTLGNGFQSTLPRGERLVKPCCLKYPFNFNPRSREGSDAEKRRGNCMAKVNFNPRSREGSDGPSDVTLLTVPVFQSTLPRGERHLPQTRCPENVYFNPRSREGSDAILSRDPRNAEISIHAPARGATMQAQKRAILQRISIHAPARGATRSLFRIAKAGSYFNPRSREGSDVNPLPRRGASIRFQSTLPRGERRSPGHSGICSQSISIHAPARGATIP